MMTLTTAVSYEGQNRTANAGGTSLPKFAESGGYLHLRRHPTWVFASSARTARL